MPCVDSCVYIEGEVRTATFDDIHPTQFAVGKVEIEMKSYKLAHKSEEKLDGYLLARPVPVVIGPSLEDPSKPWMYLVDHHHLSFSLYTAWKENKKKHDKGKKVKWHKKPNLYVKVMADWSSMSSSYFWNQMYKFNWVYLYKWGRGPMQPQKLPREIKDLDYDAYRSLAAMVRDAYGYNKVNVPFTEFKWANFFRHRLLIDDHVLDGTITFDAFEFNADKSALALTPEQQEVMAEAMNLALSPEARGLPGYKGN